MSPITFAPDSSPHLSLLLLPSRFPASRTKPCSPPCHPSRHPRPVPPQHPIADCISMGSASSQGAERIIFLGFSPHISPVEDAIGWVLPGLIEIQISASWLAISPTNHCPEPLQSSCFMLIQALSSSPRPPSHGGGRQSGCERGQPAGAGRV